MEIDKERLKNAFIDSCPYHNIKMDIVMLTIIQFHVMVTVNIVKNLWELQMKFIKTVKIKQKE